MRKIFFLLNLILILFLLNIFLNFYTIFIGDIYSGFNFNLSFFKYLQTGSNDEAVLRSLNITILLSIFSFILNVIASLVLIYLYFKGVGKKFFNLLKEKNKILFEFGIWAINPYTVEEKVINGRGKAFRVLQLLLYTWSILFPILFIFNFEVIQIPEMERIFYLISSNKIYLFIFNVILFFIISFMWFGLLFVWFLTFLSVLKK